MNEALSYNTWNDRKAQEVIESLKDYMEVIKWAYATYGEKLVYACSFGAEGIVLIDLIYKVEKHAKIVFLDTDLHFKETYRLIQQMKEKYPLLNIQFLKPELTLEEQSEQCGEELWHRDPNRCCYIRKIQPLEKALAGAEAWISGLRREQSPARAKTEYINKDEKFKSVKICPLIQWTWEDIWTYINLNDLPYNELHDRGYPSIGCEMCTVPAAETGDSRSGRWAKHTKTECGLHFR
ncbi:phosphoadenylyl-sulfate reductase [Pseudalkalibacillus caeni]|uniref:Adenosine 5'-phosphosulfate reductase n=1 Tax=Exobacillus caeni TaxID=2574798 RepID=A0A5R9FC39_9BACL|nr:phosphoadenylyl-sulfate reductase [Pseudalkalibacillus caeni]TLS38124.1 phosphoadenylyl-sulfate reductase [Pseudalkalibacillus caeni]